MTIHELITELEAMRPIALAEKEWAAIRNFMMSAFSDVNDLVTKMEGELPFASGYVKKLEGEVADFTKQLAATVAAQADMVPAADIEALKKRIAALDLQIAALQPPPVV